VTLTLEVGKLYRTRDGFCCGPMRMAEERPDLVPAQAGTLSGYIKGTGVRVFRIDGGAHVYGESALDLVAEWKDESEEASGSVSTPIPAFAWTGFGGLPVPALKGTWFTDPSGKLRQARENLDVGYIPWLEIEGVGAYRNPALTEQKSEAEEITDAQFDEARAAVFNSDDRKEANAEWFQHARNGLSFAKEYRTARTDNPPMLSVKDGTLIVSLTHEGLTLEASIGDGRSFFAQVVELLVEPALLARQTTNDFARAYMKTHGIVSPND